MRVSLTGARLPLVFVTIRSTGPDPRVDDITELTVARVTEPQPYVFAARIRATMPRATPFGVVELALPDALDVARELSRNSVLVAFDTTATRRMLDAACDFVGVSRIGFDPRSLDIRSLAWSLVPGARTLDDVRAALGVAPGSDAALGELRALLGVYRALVEVAS